MRYTLEIKWSDEDQCFVVIAPEWTDTYVMPIAEGKTYREAAERGEAALEHMIDLTRREGKPLPIPATFATS
jgi:predicted RNase H-like HicB family nuclease